ncbi:MAG: LysE family transporter [Cytophagales bacterium]
MFEIILDGFFVGLILALFVGPAFFYLIKVSLEGGFVPAAFFAFGIILSDLIIVTLIYFGFSGAMESNLFQQTFSLVSGLVLIGLGITSFNKKVKIKDKIAFEKGHRVVWYFFKGMLINGVNPFTLMIWIGVIGTLGVRQTYSPLEFRFFFSGLLTTILITDLFKAYFANKIRLLIKDKILIIVNRILAILFIIFGARMILFFFSLLLDWKGIF